MQITTSSPIATRFGTIHFRALRCCLAAFSSHFLSPFAIPPCTMCKLRIAHHTDELVSEMSYYDRNPILNQSFLPEQVVRPLSNQCSCSTGAAVNQNRGSSRPPRRAGGHNKGYSYYQGRG